MTFQYPWAAGQQLLRAAYNVGLLVGIDMLAQATTLRPVAHVSNALLKTGLLPAIPVLDELVGWLHNYLFVGGPLPAERGSLATQFMLAFGASPAAFSADNQARRAAATAKADTSASKHIYSSAKDVRLRLRGRTWPAQAAATAFAAARSRRGSSC